MSQTWVTHAPVDFTRKPLTEASGKLKDIESLLKVVAQHPKLKQFYHKSNNRDFYEAHTDEIPIDLVHEILGTTDEDLRRIDNAPRDWEQGTVGMGLDWKARTLNIWDDPGAL